MDLLRLEAITYTYPGRNTPVLAGASLSLAPGERLGILGSNGSGKSTLLHIAAGLVPAQSGSILYQGTPCATEKEFASARAQLGYLLQQSEDMLFCPTILEDVAFGPYNQGKSAAEAKAEAEQVLEELGLAHLAEYNGNSLSGGEKKLAALASVLVMRPALLFLDEPTNDLDPAARERLMAILEARLLPCVVIAHDHAFLERLCTRFCRLEDGHITDADCG